MMRSVIVDYNSGNLRSAHKSFAYMAKERNAGEVIVSAKRSDIATADRIILPGVGTFSDCKAALLKYDGLFDAIETRVASGIPFFGICVGMQLMAETGFENGEHSGFGWVKASVKKLTPQDKSLKIPHIGWNSLTITTPHPLLKGITSGDHMYFVHSYAMELDDSSDILAISDYAQDITAIIAKDNMIGTQCHPEKSQRIGLELIGNFLDWKP